MQKIFKTWVTFIFIFALIASFIVGIESNIFGFFLLPLLGILLFLIVFGFMQK